MDAYNRKNYLQMDDDRGYPYFVGNHNLWVEVWYNLLYLQKYSLDPMNVIYDSLVITRLDDDDDDDDDVLICLTAVAKWRPPEKRDMFICSLFSLEVACLLFLGGATTRYR